MKRFVQKVVLVFLIICLMCWSGSVFAAADKATNPDVDKLLDLLVQKGIITIEEAAALRADLAIQKQEEKEKQKDFFTTASRYIRFSGYTELRYRTDKTINDTFDLRRARLDIRGDFTPNFDYRMHIEFGGGSVKLLDATMGFKAGPGFKLMGGQFKIPFSQENLISSNRLESINRSQVVEGLVARGKDVIGNQNGRDIGIQAGGSLFARPDGTYLFDYAAGVFNGAGINTTDTNDRKDFVGRLVFHPRKELSVGGSVYRGRYTPAAAPTSLSDRNRAGVEFAYVRSPLLLKGEYVRGEDGAVRKHGWYLLGGYFLVPAKLQAIVKYDSFDPERDIDKNETNVWTLGGNWFFNKWAFVQVNYELKTEAGKDVDNNQLAVEATFQF